MTFEEWFAAEMQAGRMYWVDEDAAIAAWGAALSEAAKQVEAADTIFAASTVKRILLAMRVSA